MNITFATATMNDSALLAAMNRQLIKDEDSQNPMTLEQLQHRMEEWLQSNWSIVLVLHRNEPIGYLLFQERQHEYFPERMIVYVRQFFVGRSYRRRGIGRATFEQIVSDYFPTDTTIELDILETNPQGRAFWEELGFHPYSTTMQRIVPTSAERAR